MKEIYLCGTVHADLKGPERLEKVIQKIQPDFITVESNTQVLDTLYSVHNDLDDLFKYTSFGEPVVKDMAAALFSEEQMSKINMESLVAFYKIMGYEAWVPRMYNLKNPSVGLLGIDDGIDSDTAVKNVESRIAKELTKYLKLDPRKFQEAVDKRYEEKICKEAKLIKLSERNIYMANRIKRLESPKIFHIGGYAHMFGNSPNMYELLQDGPMQKLIRIKLPEADSLEN